MPENKKSYKEVADANLTKGKLLETIYAELSQMPEGAISARIAEIEETMRAIGEEALTRQEKATRQKREALSSQIDPKEMEKAGVVPKEIIVDSDAIVANETALEELTDISIQLRNELKILKTFPKVKHTMDRIAEVKDDLVARKADIQAKIENASLSLEEAKKKVEEIEAKKARAEEIDKEIASREEAILDLDGKYPYRIEAYKKEIEDLNKEKAELGTEEEWKKDIRKVSDIKGNLTKYSKSRDKIDEGIRKCENPWRELINGMYWKEIGEITDEQLSEKLQIKLKRSKLKPPEKPKSKDKDRDKKKDGEDGKKKKEKNGQGQGIVGQGGGAYPPPSPPNPPNPPAPDAAREEGDDDNTPPPDQDEKKTLAERFKEWRENHRAEMEIKKDGEEEMKRRVQELKEEERRGRRERLARRFPKIFGRKEEEAKRGKLSLKERLARRFPKIFGRKEEEKTEIVQFPEVELVEPDESQPVKISMEERRDAILAAKPTREEIARLGGTWIKEGIFTAEDVAKMEANPKFKTVMQIAQKEWERQAKAKAEAEAKKVAEEAKAKAPTGHEIFTSSLDPKNYGPVNPAKTQEEVGATVVQIQDGQNSTPSAPAVANSGEKGGDGGKGASSGHGGQGGHGEK